MSERAMALLREQVDEPTMRLIEDRVLAGAYWMADPEASGVVGLFDVEWQKIVVVVYFEESVAGQEVGGETYEIGDLLYEAND